MVLTQRHQLTGGAQGGVGATDCSYVMQHRQAITRSCSAVDLGGVADILPATPPTPEKQPEQPLKQTPPTPHPTPTTRPQGTRRAHSKEQGP